MNTTGPAPTDDGDTETRESFTYTVKLTGVGGRTWLAALPPPLPQPEIPSTLAPTTTIILIRIRDLVLLSKITSATASVTFTVDPARTLSDRDFATG
jgi:hypothetical protein